MERAQLRVRAYIVRRNEILISENEMWRRIFAEAYKKIFSSSTEAEAVLNIILKKFGVKPIRRLRDYSEAEFVELLEEKQAGQVALPVPQSST